MQFYQGDLKIEEVDGIPAGVTPFPRDARGRFVLAHGESTGNAHAITDPDAEMFEDEDGTLWLRAPNAVLVVHEKHGPITLAPRSYRIESQVQWQDEPVRVLD